MSENLWENDFKSRDEILPKNILEDQCEFLGDATNNKIIGVVSAYEEPIVTYEVLSPFQNISKSMQGEIINIQDKLGEIEESGRMAYQFYLTSEMTPNYKYRVLFIEYGIERYPLDITMDQTIALEIGMAEEVKCENENEFTSILGRIINSKKILNVIESLLNLNK